MPRNTIKRKMFRRKFKRRAAALAGAAIMTGAAITGMPLSKASAAEVPHPTPAQQTAQVNKDARPPGYGWHQHDRSWPGSNDNQGWVQDGKIFYRHAAKPLQTWYVRAFGDPTDVVAANASAYGFDSTLDQFTLLTVNRHRALVEVRQHDTGRLYNVLLTRDSDQGWAIVDVHGI